MDPRDRAKTFGPLLPPGTVDEKRWVYVLDSDFVEYNDAPSEISFKYGVCTLCGGIGKHVNPSIDAHGITSSEWNDWSYEDQMNYRNGYYDVECHECKGQKVVVVLDPIEGSIEHIWLKNWEENELADRREIMSEIKYGY